MVAIKAHFDGRVLVPDEPVNLPRDEQLIVHVERPAAGAHNGPRAGSARGKIRMSDDFDAPLDDFVE